MAHYCPDGEKAVNSKGAHRQVFTYNSRNLVTSKSLIDEKGSPATGPRGYHRIDCTRSVKCEKLYLK